MDAFARDCNLMGKMELRKWSLTAGFMFVLVGLFVSMSVVTVSPVEAQFEEPTATPNQPYWIGFSIIRDAIEEEESVDLSTVASWNFVQSDWSAPNANHPQQATGIDSCVSTVITAEARPIYFGLSYTITALNGNRYEARVSFDLEDYAICDILSVPVETAPASDDSAGTDGDLPEPVAGAGAGGSFELGGHVTFLTGPAVDAMQRSGMTWVKKQVRLSDGLGTGQDYISSADANGFNVLLGVIGDRDALGADPDGYAQQYADFVASLAAAGADAIEVWNEPNIDREWPAGQISGANYTSLLAVAYNAIKSANPNTIVVSGAPAPTGFFGAAGCGSGGCNDDVFMQQMAAAGAANYLDCVGLHYNEGIVAPNVFSGDPRGEYPTYYFESMTNRGANAFPGKPVCYTELGYLSPEGMGGPLPGAFAWAADTSVAEQASWLAGAAARAAQRGDVRLMIVWNVNFERYDTDPMGGYAMIRPDGTCPACDTLGTVMGG